MTIDRRTLLKTALVASPMLVASRVLGLDGETVPSEDVAQRDRDLPVRPLEALHARERGALEVLLQRRRNGIRLLRRQKAEVELLFVVHEVPHALSDGFRYLQWFFHASYYTISPRDR